MSNNPNLISNMSYTSKDFNTIYPELLDLVKKITYKWDPSISNESDPGVILLKLNAIIADKCNYNIDKNVLECFPLSVTQESNARQLYEQLGYFMKWYRSATTKVSITWTDFENYTKSSTSYVTIPKFTMVTDYDNSIVYTLLGIEDSEWNSASNLKLYLDGEPVVFNAIQGIFTQYDINGETTIQASDLDTNHRLYFNSSNIAENGIFISNIDSENFASWVRKESLATEDLGNTFYSFGVLPGTNTCYLEFPEDAETIFRNGIAIGYISTQGRDGNIPISFIEKFYNDLTTVLNIDGDESSIIINSDNVEIVNTVAGLGGENKESLESAFRSYQRTVGTFNTLVTLRDYVNAILNSPEYASNAIVTDRTNDIQCSYKVMSLVNNVDTLVTKTDIHEDNPAMNAYNIKLYVLDYASPTINNTQAYNRSFELLDDSELGKIKMYIEDEKCIPHDYTSLRTPEGWDTYEVLVYEPTDWSTNYSSYYKLVDGEYVALTSLETFVTDTYYQKESNFRTHYCLFKNIYPIDCRITPVRTLDDVEKADLKSNITAYLCEKLNSRQVDFGETITAYQLEQLITEADERVSSTSIQNVLMKTFVVYWNGIEFKTIDLSRYSDSDNPEPYLYSYIDYRYKNVTASANFMNKVGNKPWGVYTFKYIDSTSPRKWYMSKIEDNNGPSAYVQITNITEYVNNLSGITYKDGDWFSIEINPVDRVRDEIFVKSVLQGVTPLFVDDNGFSFDINQTQSMNETTHQRNGLHKDVESIELNSTITFNSTTSTYYTLRENESLRFCTANLLNGNEFSNYVKYYFIGTEGTLPIPDGVNRLLEDGEYLFLFWKETSDSNDPYVYEVYGKGNIISPVGFTLDKDDTNASSSSVFGELIDNMYTIVNGNTSRDFGSSATYRGLKSSENAYAESIKNWLSGTKRIQTKFINSIDIPSNYYCYWFLNNKDADNRFVLFKDFSRVQEYSGTAVYKIGDYVKVTSTDVKYYECITRVNREATFNPQHWREVSATEYVLDTGEYFMYKSSTGSALNILGSGTRIQRRNYLNEMAVDAVSFADISYSSESALNNIWYAWPSESALEITVTEQQYTNIGSGATILFEFVDEAQTTEYVINSSSYVELTDVQNIWYTFDKLQDDQKSNPVYYDNKLSDVSGVDSWRSISRLNCTLGSGQEQVLLSNQSIILNYVKNENNEGDTYSIYGQDETDESYPVVVQSLFDIDSAGSSSFIYTFDYNEDGDKIYDTIYVYSKAKNDIEETFKIYYNSTDGGATCTFPIATTTTEVSDIPISFSVPYFDSESEGYILSVYNPNTDMIGAELTVLLNGTVLYPLAEKSDFNIAESGVYFFELPIEANVLYSLTLRLTNLIRGEVKSIVLNKLFKYKKPEDITDEQFNNYVNMIGQYDIDKQFNYTYDVPENTLISDPLDPYSFMNSYHIYNAFTICQFDTKDTTFTISTR